MKSKKQSRYHIYKKSFIDNWTKFNSKNNFKNFKLDDDLMLLDSESLVPNIAPSNQSHFYILYKSEDENKLDLLEKQLNKKGGPEYLIDALEKKLIEIERKNDTVGTLYKLTSSKKMLNLMQFWRERWETVVDWNYLIELNDNFEFERINHPKENLLAHISSQYNSLYKLGYILESDLPLWFNKENLNDEWVNEKYNWDFDEYNSEIFLYVNTTQEMILPIFYDPILLFKSEGETIFHFQLSPYHTILIYKKNSKLIQSLKLNGATEILYRYLTLERSYKTFFPFLIDKNKINQTISDWFPIMEMILEVSWKRRYFNIRSLNKDSKNKIEFVYDISFAISQIKTLTNFNLIKEDGYLHFVNKRKKIIFIKKSDINNLEKKINEIITKEKLIEIHLRESKKNSKNPDLVTREVVEKNLAMFNFDNKFTDDEK